MLERIVVVGGSLAGLRAVESLRAGGYDGELIVVGAETHRPYDRPPLSKKLLAGEWEPDRIELRKPDDLDSLGVTWRLGAPATGLDVDGAPADGRRRDARSPFDGLVIATGSAPRRLPGQADWPHVVELRTLDDALDLRARLRDGTARVVVIGAGFIGLEVAATARRAGQLRRRAGGRPGAVDQRPRCRDGSRVRGDPCRPRRRDPLRHHASTSIDAGGVLLGDGEHVPGDVIVVGIGVAPVTDWLAGSGLEIRDGIVCDSMLNAGVPGVYAAGDVARWPNSCSTRRCGSSTGRTPPNRAPLAASNLLAEARGEPGEAVRAGAVLLERPVRPAHPVPRPGGRRRRRAGRQRFDRGAVVLVLYGRDGRLHGVLGMNLPRLVMKFRPLLAQRATWQAAVDLQPRAALASLRSAELDVGAGDLHASRR